MLIFFHNWINKLLSEENKIPRTGSCLKLERWQGPPHINKVKQYETVWSFKIILFIQFIHENRGNLFIKFA